MNGDDDDPDPYIEALIQEAVLMHYGYDHGTPISQMSPEEVAERLGVHFAVDEKARAAQKDKSWFDAYMARGSHGVGL